MMGCDIHPYAEVRTNGRWKKAAVEIPRDRNYVAFGKLANVRNGHGFAGVDTGDAVMPISNPRGLPGDTSIRDSEPDDVWLGDHSHSWVLLSELLMVDLDAMVTRRGMVKRDAAEKFRRDGIAPTEWCGGVWGPSAGEYETIEWKEPLKKAAYLLPEIIEAIRPLGDPKDVRLVFGFDS